MCKKSCFIGPIDKQHGKRAIILLKSVTQEFHHIYWSLSRQLRWEKILFLTCRILGLLAHTFAVDDKYAFLNWENLTIPIEMQLSWKQKTFSEFFSAFLNSTLKLKYLVQKDEPHRFCISEITDSKSEVR